MEEVMAFSIPCVRWGDWDGRIDVAIGVVELREG